jgi:hypothetical protein
LVRREERKGEDEERRGEEREEREEREGAYVRKTVGNFE